MFLIAITPVLAVSAAFELVDKCLDISCFDPWAVGCFDVASVVP
jgi:hypothetical protein